MNTPSGIDGFMDFCLLRPGDYPLQVTGRFCCLAQYCDHAGIELIMICQWGKIFVRLQRRIEH